MATVADVAGTSPTRSNATVITLEEAPAGYQDFDQGVAKRFVINPDGLIKA